MASVIFCDAANFELIFFCGKARFTVKSYIPLTSHTLDLELRQKHATAAYVSTLVLPYAAWCIVIIEPGQVKV